MMFGRKKKAAAEDRASSPQETGREAVEDSAGDELPATGAEAPETDGAHARVGDLPDGPRDRSEVDDLGRLIDLGSVHALPGPGMELRLELDSATQEVSAIQMATDEGAVQVQVFAAPRSSGIWEEIRAEISEMITGNGGTVEEVAGTFGPELRTRLAQSGPQGRTVFAPAVFAGIDGSRWFLRAVYSGSPAVDETARRDFDDCIRRVVVTRGEEPRAPREMLPLTMPEATSAGPTELDEDGSPTGEDLRPFERGPEITEVR